MKQEYKEILLQCGMSLDFVLCRAGSFYMGSGSGEAGRDTDERRHAVAIEHDFWIGRYPVTQSQWECVMGINPSRIKDGELPIVNVSFGDCQAFANAVGEDVGVNVRLPKETEWEYACRAGTETAYCWGDNPGGGIMPTRLSPVVTCWQNQWGISGMHGNVFEWCDDWYDADYGIKTNRRVGFEVERYRVVRGGSWASDPQDCRSAFREREDADFRSHEVGFRICITGFPEMPQKKGQ